MTKKNALGRGLGALIEGVEKEVLEKKVEANLQIAVDSIDVIRFNPGQDSTNSRLMNLQLRSNSLVLFSP